MAQPDNDRGYVYNAIEIGVLKKDIDADKQFIVEIDKKMARLVEQRDARVASIAVSKARLKELKAD